MTDVAAASAAAPPAHPTAWKSQSGFGFRDLIDIVNPLQHIPIVSSVYRWLTGDRPGEAAQIAGDALYGGPIGVGLGLASAAMEDNQGHDIGERALIAMFGPHDGTTAVASAAPAGSGPAQAPSSVKAAPVSAAAPMRAPMPLFGGIAQPIPGAVASTASAPASATASPVTLAAPARAPIPLYGGIAQPAPGPDVSVAQNPARAFEAHQAMLERAITGRTGPAPAAPVPLVLPAGTLLNRVPATPAATPPNPAQPTDISQKMLDGLDKYMQLEREREGKDGTAPPAAGSQLDLAL